MFNGRHSLPINSHSANDVRTAKLGDKKLVCATKVKNFAARLVR